MRIVLIGLPEDRERLRQAFSSLPIDVVDEAATLAAARAAGVRTDAYVIAPDTTSDDRDEALIEPLTAREIDVLELLAEGLPNKAIAARLHISDQTVKFHVAQICGKLGAANRTDAVRLAVRRWLVTI